MLFMMGKTFKYVFYGLIIWVEIMLFNIFRQVLDTFCVNDLASVPGLFIAFFGIVVAVQECFNYRNVVRDYKSVSDTENKPLYRNYSIGMLFLSGNILWYCVHFGKKLKAWGYSASGTVSHSRIPSAILLALFALGIVAVASIVLSLNIKWFKHCTIAVGVSFVLFALGVFDSDFHSIITAAFGTYVGYIFYAIFRKATYRIVDAPQDYHKRKTEEKEKLLRAQKEAVKKHEERTQREKNGCIISDEWSCEHDWIPFDISIIHHEAIWHYEDQEYYETETREVVIQDAYDEWRTDEKVWYDGYGDEHVDRIPYCIHHDAVKKIESEQVEKYGPVRVIDTPAYDEKKVGYYICRKCGERKQAE